MGITWVLGREFFVNPQKRTSIASKTIFKIAAVLTRLDRIFTLAFPAQLIPEFGLPR
jgi:hypothetical protein